MKKITALTLTCILSASCNLIPANLSAITTNPSATTKASPSPSNPTTSASAVILSSLPRSMKGYELYSWKVENDWYFTLITGTNRNKTYEEITAKEDSTTLDGFVKITVKGTDAIKEVLKKIPANEFISWGANTYLGFSLPAKDVVDDLTSYCKTLNLQMNSFSEVQPVPSPSQAPSSSPVIIQPSQPAVVLSSIPHSMKGYELYSWKVDNELYFTLITGTNRNKTYEEITAKDNNLNPDTGLLKITVKGIDAIKDVLKKIPPNEYIFWLGTKDSGFTLPSQDVVDDLKNYCKTLNLSLV